MFYRNVGNQGRRPFNFCCIISQLDNSDESDHILCPSLVITQHHTSARNGLNIGKKPQNGTRTVGSLCVPLPSAAQLSIIFSR